MKLPPPGQTVRITAHLTPDAARVIGPAPASSLSWAINTALIHYGQTVGQFEQRKQEKES
jgi:hypothetical protein